jgi:hypothetical protein
MSQAKAGLKYVTVLSKSVRTNLQDLVYYNYDIVKTMKLNVIK